MNPPNRKALYKIAEMLNFSEELEEQPEVIEEAPKKKKKKN